MIKNIRKLFKYQLKSAINASDQLSDASSAAVVQETTQQLSRWYRRLYFLDRFNIVILQPRGGAETRIYMTEEQIRKNDELRDKEDAPMVETRLERVHALEETVTEQLDYHSSTASKASPAAKPMPPWAKPQEPRVPPPPSTPDVPSPPPMRSSHRRLSEPPWAVAARRNDDSSSDEPRTPSESPSPVTPLPLAGTLIAVFPKAAPPTIKAPPEAVGPPARAAPVSETTVQVPRDAATETVVEAMDSTPIMVKAMPPYKWTLYEKGRKRAERTVTPAVTAQSNAHTPPRYVSMEFLFQAHEVHPSQVLDWTLVEDPHEEQRLREVRNYMITDFLLSKRSVQFRSTGSSLAPMVQSGDVTMWEPITDHSVLEVGDVVFCAVQPGDRFFGHMIHNIGDWYGAKYWSIGNMKDPPRINGWCLAEHIFGRLLEVSSIKPAAM